MKRLNFYFTELQIAALRRVSEATGLSVSELLRRAVDDWLRKESEHD
jgi:hypothetical protein